MKKAQKALPVSCPSKQSADSDSSADFRLQNEGSIAFLHPLTARAVSWVNEHVGQNNGYQPMWPSVLIEPRYVAPILEGIASDGLNVA